MKKTDSAALANFDWFDNQRLAFVAFFLIGAVGVITLKEYELGPFIAIAYSFAVMLSYVTFCWTRPYPIRPDIIGDNIYYLGFLFTLVSLAYTLYKFTSADAEIDQIIKNFGIALSTTLMGVVGRVYFNQTHDETDDFKKEVGNLLDQEQALHLNLSERTSDLIMQIDTISSELIELKNNTIVHVQDATAQSLAQFSSRLQAMSEQHAVRMDQDVQMQIALQQVFSSNMTASNEALGEFAASVKQSSQIIHADIRESQKFYGQFIGDITQESNRALGALGSLKSSLSMMADPANSSSHTDKE